MTQENTNEPKTFKVRITKSTLNTYWYASRIGDIFEVYPSVLESYKVATNTLDESYIDESDCELIQDTPEPFMFQGYPLNVGDKLWHDKRGECKVISINADAPRSIAVDSYGSFLRNGCYNADDQEPTLYWDKPQFELPKKPEPKVKKYLVLWQSDEDLFAVSQDYYASLEEFELRNGFKPIHLILESAKEYQ